MADWPSKHDGPCACRFVRREEFGEAEQVEWCGLHARQREELERLRTGHQRYETARRMNPRQWAAAWKLNTTTGKPFDEIIDNMRPFMVPNEIAKGRG